MAQYLVKRNPHFRDGTLYPIGATVTLEKPLPNEKDWATYLERLPDPKPQEPLTPEEALEAAKSEEAELLAKLKEAQTKKAELAKKVPQK